MNTKNNVAAQAGDEPMRVGAEAAFERYLVKQKYIVGMPGLAARPCYCAGYQAGLDAAQVSPRATADVQRDQAIRDLVRLWDCEVFHPDEYNEEMCRIEAIIRATTKPGA